jgi:hypothetical protein
LAEGENAMVSGAIDATHYRFGHAGNMRRTPFSFSDQCDDDWAPLTGRSDRFPWSGMITGVQMHTAPDPMAFAADVAIFYRPSPSTCVILHSRILSCNQ